MSVTNISADQVTPQDVIDSVTKELVDIEQVFVVALKRRCVPKVWASGSLDTLPKAAMILQLRALEVLREEME